MRSTTWQPVSALILAAMLLAGCDRDGGTPPSDAAAPSAPAGADGASTNVAPSAPDESPATAKGAAIEVVPVTPEELKKLIADQKDKAVLVDFWATWCVNCRKEYPHTVELSKKHKDDLVVYSLSMDETDDETIAMIREALAPYADGNVRNLRSAKGGEEGVYEAFEITGGALPHYKVFGRDGALVATFGGDVDVMVEPGQIDAAVTKAMGD